MRTADATAVMAKSASRANAGSPSNPSSVFHIDTIASCPPVKEYLVSEGQLKIDDAYRYKREMICLLSVLGKSKNCAARRVRAGTQDFRHDEMRAEEVKVACESWMILEIAYLDACGHTRACGCDKSCGKT